MEISLFPIIFVPSVQLADDEQHDLLVANQNHFTAALNETRGDPASLESGEVVLIGDEEVVLLVALVVRELNGGSRRLGLRGCDALLHVVKGYFEHLPFGGGGDGVQEGGERTHVRRWGGKGGGDRGAGSGSD